MQIWLISSSDVSISFRIPQNHQGICPQESVYCENKCGARMMRRLLSQHTMTECPKRTQPCKYCGKEFVYDTIQVSNTAQQTSTPKSLSALSDLDNDFSCGPASVPQKKMNANSNCLLIFLCNGCEWNSSRSVVN